MNKNKIFKIIFWLSFLPYIILILISTYHAVFGYEVHTWFKGQYVRTIYGIDAFRDTIVWNGLRLCFVPILPISLIIEVIYIIIYIIKKIKIKIKKA